MVRIELEKTARLVVEAGYRVHKELGPGLLESVYLFCLVEELKIKGLRAAKEVFLPLTYRGIQINKDFRIDLLVEDELIIETKAVEILLPVHKAQLISYLKLSDKRLGFLINFNVPVFKDGIHRFVNKY
ncbi:MAG: GxxExxY protein [Bacteroidota bacterium]